MDAWIGQIVGKYRILDWVGQGGMATVYKAWDLERNRLVAFKALFPYLINDPSFRARFEREAKILHRLRHPHIIPVLDFGEAEGLLYLVMPYITLGSLSDRLEAGPVSVEQGSKIIRQIADALQFAHDRNVIHRDVKPSNILVDDNFSAWLSDFGFARMHDASMSISGSSLVGTPAYMSPEQILGHTTAPSSDQYALGVVLYQLATGKLPYEAETPMGLALKHATEPLPRPRSVNPNLPDAVEEVIVKALSKDSNFRYPSVTAFSDAYQAALYQIYDAHSGKLKSGSVGPPPSMIIKPTVEPVREAVAPLSMPVVPKIQHRRPVRKALLYFAMPVIRSIKRRRALPWVAALLLLLVPATAFAFTLFGQSQTARLAQVVEATPTDRSALSTHAAVEQSIIGQSGRVLDGEAVETFVAATATALQSQQNTPTTFGAAGTEAATNTATFGPGTVTPLISPTSTSTRAAGILPSPTDPPPGGSPTASASASPGSTPTVRPSSTQTGTPPSPTETDEPPEATATDEPATATNTPEASATTAPTATSPPADPCASLSAGGYSRDGKTVGWELRNDGSSAQTITSVRLSWPAENSSLFKVNLGGSTIWVGDEPASPTTVSTWIGGDASRTFTGDKPIEFRFKSNAADGTYGLVVNFASGCNVSR